MSCPRTHHAGDCAARKFSRTTRPRSLARRLQALDLLLLRLELLHELLESSPLLRGHSAGEGPNTAKKSVRHRLSAGKARAVCKNNTKFMLGLTSDFAWSNRYSIIRNRLVNDFEVPHTCFDSSYPGCRSSRCLGRHLVHLGQRRQRGSLLGSLWRHVHGHSGSGLDRPGGKEGHGLRGLPTRRLGPRDGADRRIGRHPA